MIAVMAGAIIGVLNTSGLGFALTQTLVQLSNGYILLVLVMAAIVSIVLGMGMPTVGVYLLLATLVVPSMVELGIPRMAAHLFAIYFGMLSMITPPVALAAFAAATLAEAPPISTAIAACRFGWVAYLVPFLFVLSPELLLTGEPLSVALTVVTAFIGVLLVSIGLIGYFRSALSGGVRALYIIAGLALFIPKSAFTGAVWSDVLGGLLAIALFMVEFAFWRRLPSRHAAE